MRKRKLGKGRGTSEALREGVMCCCLYSLCTSIDLLLTSFHAVTIKTCSVPNIELHFPSAGLSALWVARSAVGRETPQPSLAGPYSSPQWHPILLTPVAPHVPLATFWRELPKHFFLILFEFYFYFICMVHIHTCTNAHACTYMHTCLHSAGKPSPPLKS